MNCLVADGEFFVADYHGHAVVVFGKDGCFKRRLESKIKNEWYPGGIYVTADGTVLVAYSFEHRFNVVAFNRVGQGLFFSRGPPDWVTHTRNFIACFFSPSTLFPLQVHRCETNLIKDYLFRRYPRAVGCS